MNHKRMIQTHLVGDLPGCEAYVTCIGLAHGGREALTVGDAGALWAWSVADGRSLRKLALGPEAKAADSICSNASGDLHALTWGNEVCVVSTQAWRELGRVQAALPYEAPCAWAPQGDQLAIGTENGLLLIWDAANCRTKCEYQLCEEAIKSLDWHSEANELVFVTDNGIVGVYHLHDGLRATRTPDDARFTWACWAPNGRIVTLDQYDNIQLWPSHLSGAITTVTLPGLAEAATRDGDSFVVAYATESDLNTIRLRHFRAGSLQVVRDVELEIGQSVTSVSVLPNDSGYAVATNGGDPVLFDTRGRVRVRLRGHEPQIFDCVWPANVVGLVDAGGTCRVFSTADCSLRWDSGRIGLMSAASRMAGSRILLGDNDGVVWTYSCDRNTSEELCHVSDQIIGQICLDERGVVAWLACSYSFSRIVLTGDPKIQTYESREDSPGPEIIGVLGAREVLVRDAGIVRLDDRGQRTQLPISSELLNEDVSVACNGKEIAIATPDRIMFYTLAGELLRQMPWAARSCAPVVECDSNGRMIVTWDNTALIFHDDQQSQVVLEGEDDYWLMLSPDGTHAVAVQGGACRLWRLGE